MNTLTEYIEIAEPVRGSETVRYEITKKAKEYADKFFPNDKEKNKICAMAYMLGMYDTLELVFY